MRRRILLLATIALLGAPSCGPFEPFQRLGYGVVDAAYSQSTRRLVMISAGPPALHLYDPLSRTEQEITLPADPTCLGLSPDGNFAAVGHDHLVSYVALGSGTLVQTYPVSLAVGNVVVADNGQIYASQQTGDPSPQLSVLDIASGAEQVFATGGTRARQRPGLETLYVDNTNVNPEAESSLDIGGGGASRLHVTPYFDTHPFCGNFWFSQDGQRIFSACGDTFRASSSRDQDMRFTGALSNAPSVQDLFPAAPVHHVLVIPRPTAFGDPLADAQVQLYHDAALGYRGSMALPAFVEDGQTFPAHGRFVFFDESGSNVIVVQQADPSAGLQQDFAVFVVGFAPSSFTGASGPTPPPVLEQAFPTFGAPIEDATYDRALDRIVFVSSDPDRLHILDPETGEDRQVALPFAPNSVSIAPAGDHAAVAHDGGHISLVDLPSATLVADYLATYSSSSDVLDVVATADRIYLFQRLRPVGLNWVEVSTGAHETTYSIPVGSDSRGVLDATDGILYVTSGVEDGDALDKIDVSTQPPAYVTSLLGDACTAAWLSEDGARIFTRCGNVFQSIPGPTMSLEGTLAGTSPVRHLSDSTAAGLIAAIPGVPDYDAFGLALIPANGWNGDTSADTRVALFAASSLSFQRDVPLAPFDLVSTTAPARGRFVFFNSLGTRIYVIVEADPSSGLVNGFGIQSFDVH